MSTQDEKPAPEATDEATDRLITGAEQQVGAGEQVEGVEQREERPEPGSGAQGGELPSAAEAEDRGVEQQSEDDEEAAGLDEALDESFPASDPPAHTTKGRAK